MATVTIDYMRSALCDVYNTRKWREAVCNMPDNQVIAIYHSFLNRGMFDKGPPKKLQPKKEPTYKQLSFDDILKGGM